MSTSLPAVANPAPAPRIASIVSVVCLLFAIALPISTLYAAIFDPELVIRGLDLHDPPNAAQLNVLQRIGLAVLEMIPPIFQAYGLLCARRCFQSFAHGEYFTLEIVKGLRGFAAGVFFAIIAGMLTTPILTVLLTMTSAHELTLTARFSSEELLRLVFAGILWQIAAVMMRAVKIAEEHSQFV
jgi:hypothetical protein